MRLILIFILLLATLSTFGSEYHVGDQSSYKYSQIFDGESDYRIQTQTVVEVKADSKMALITIAEFIGANGPVVYKTQTWSDLREIENAKCKTKLIPLTVEAGTFDVCLDYVDSEGLGAYLNYGSEWPYVRTTVKSCASQNSGQVCETYNLDLISVNSKGAR